MTTLLVGMMRSCSRLWRETYVVSATSASEGSPDELETRGEGERAAVMVEEDDLEMREGKADESLVLDGRLEEDEVEEAPEPDEVEEGGVEVEDEEEAEVEDFVEDDGDEVPVVEALWELLPLALDEIVDDEDEAGVEAEEEGEGGTLPVPSSTPAGRSNAASPSGESFLSSPSLLLGGLSQGLSLVSL